MLPTTKILRSNSSSSSPGISPNPDIMSALAAMETRLSSRMDSNTATIGVEIDTLRKYVDKKIDSIVDTVNTNSAAFDNKLADIRAEMEQKIDDLNSKLEAVNKTADLQGIIQDRLERSHLHLDLLVTGIPATHDENVNGIIVAIAKAIGFHIDDPSIFSCFRILHRSHHQPLIVKFKTSSAKNKFLNLYWKLSNLNLNHVGFETNNRIYVSECLTKKNLAILKVTKLLKKNKEIFKFQIRNGLIFVNIHEGDTAKCVLSEKQLSTFLNK